MYQKVTPIIYSTCITRQVFLFFWRLLFLAHAVVAKIDQQLTNYYNILSIMRRSNCSALVPPPGTPADITFLVAPVLISLYFFLALPYIITNFTLLRPRVLPRGSLVIALVRVSICPSVFEYLEDHSLFFSEILHEVLGS